MPSGTQPVGHAVPVEGGAFKASCRFDLQEIVILLHWTGIYHFYQPLKTLSTVCSESRALK